MSSGGDDPAAVRARLLALVSHHLRVPLSRIAAQSTDAASAAAARGQLEWLDSLRLCLRNDGAPPQQVACPLYLHALLRQAAAAGATLAREHGRAFAHHEDPALPAVVALDGSHLAQALRQLMSVAARRCGTGGVRFSLQAFEQQGAVRLCFRIEAGADDAAWDEVAPAFSDDLRADVGLALAAQLVRAMQGRLLQSGDCWRFELDAQVAAERDVLAPAPEFQLPAPFGRGRTVLLLEPQAALRDYLMEILESAGFDVAGAGDAGDARPALIVCGDEALAWRLLRAGGPPVLLHAARPPRRPAGLPVTLELAAVLYKPVTPEALLAAVRR
ncbi:hypothetical protein Jab_1c03870 [Janthinobacterium sp. HH01]|uniref:response regulator n=1 Tax=Janthinobacterium sp. HH01 TaxID=1198452 RepID=UPI0002AEB6ED|nr:response regulator [Janthinobacterium sp. HH01]ELX11800.1 hypothetical protein Jab_1c03870 [Janthinobacterium sp. HH01]